MEHAHQVVEGQRLAPVPITVIGGFLGAGKTTLLNTILSEDHGLRAGVLVNDFGAINIDARLVVGVDGETVNLANGCVCCTIRDDLLTACLRLLSGPEPPQRLIIEASGVSDPVQVANTFVMPELQHVLALDSMFAVVDSEQFPRLLAGEMAALASVQIQAADMVVLNKVDLVSGADLARVRTLVRKIAPGSRIFETIQGRVPLEPLLGAGFDEPRHRRLDSRQVGVERDHHRHFSTWHWTCDRPLSLPKVRALLGALPDTIYRAKGIVYLEELPSYQITLQLVGKRSELNDTEPWGSEPPRSEIVLIASRGGIDGDKLQRAFDDCIGTGDESQSPVLRLTRRLRMG